jgi:hypothetical protein
VRARYQKDPIFTKPECLKELRCSEDGLWWHEDALVIPDAGTLRRDIMHEGHDVLYRGHFGVDKTVKSFSFGGQACGLMCWPMSGHVQVSLDLILELPPTAQGYNATCRDLQPQPPPTSQSRPQVKKQNTKL